MLKTGDCYASVHAVISSLSTLYYQYQENISLKFSNDSEAQGPTDATQCYAKAK